MRYYLAVCQNLNLHKYFKKMDKEKFERADEIRMRIWGLSEKRYAIADWIKGDELDPINVAVTFKGGRRLTLPVEAFAVDIREVVVEYIASFDKKIAELEEEFSAL